MAELTQRVQKEISYKDEYALLRIFQQMMEQGEVTAYTQEGRRLTPTSELRENRHFLLKDKTGAEYQLYIRSEGGIISEDGDQTMYDSCFLERVKRGKVTARLTIDSHTHWTAGSEIDYISGEGSKLRVEGKEDELLKKICGYL